jgi:hypothetical protein
MESGSHYLMETGTCDRSKKMVHLSSVHWQLINDYFTYAIFSALSLNGLSGVNKSAKCIQNLYVM